jgi:hypothetical protein
MTQIAVPIPNYNKLGTIKRITSLISEIINFKKYTLNKVKKEIILYANTAEYPRWDSLEGINYNVNLQANIVLLDRNYNDSNMESILIIEPLLNNNTNIAPLNQA